jgi:hypothetical protein
MPYNANMPVSLDQLREWMSVEKSTTLEFKEAKNLRRDKLVRYCAALANEGGGSSLWYHG